MSWTQKGKYILYDNSERFLKLSDNAYEWLNFEYGDEAAGAKIKKNLYKIFDEMESILESIDDRNFSGFFISRAIDPTDVGSPHSEGRAIDISRVYLKNKDDDVYEEDCYHALDVWRDFLQLFEKKYPKPFNQIICPFGIIDVRWNKEIVVNNFMNNKLLEDLEYVNGLVVEHQDHFHINLAK
ncbi:MAG: hypothetical protein AMQ22_01082 [Candidatus Methanofastidiosum methylothiophilum]|uniref:Uncharacterized protein n=1 Tax=Candidatus Methanofastidiosum methylothiophilum TaxID=1705564 RepID=A0A150J3X4_9EURY|nr:MAG: hypothetical protein AMQ22_01082 [Candidatus Methanofastidiosum methylthiophilus]